MSVFSTEPKTQHVRNVVVLVGVCAVIVGGIVASRELSGPLTAALQEAMHDDSSVPVSMATETVFPQPRDVDWEGVVFGVLAGGNGFAVKRDGTGELFQAYLADGLTAEVAYEPVRVRGRWTGVSCAYKDTVFKGACTPTVDVDVFEVLPITLE